MKLLLASLIALTPVPSLADNFVQDIPRENEIWREQSQQQQTGFSRTKTCYRTEYREEYVPGTREDPGFIRTFNELIEVPCRSKISDPIIKRETVVEYDDNDCTDGKVAGALLGGAAGAAMSRDDGRWWAIPIGAVIGSKIGCDAAGG